MFRLVVLFALAAFATSFSEGRTPLEVRSEGAISCDVCRAMALLLELGFARNATQNSLLGDVSLLCQRVIPTFSKQMCDGLIVQRFGPVAYAILEKLGGKLPGVCEYIGACKQEMTPERKRLAEQMTRERRIRSEEKKKRSSSSSSAAAAYYFVQLSDVHYDQYYQEGTSQLCNFTLCCRAEMGTAGLPLSGHFGSYGSPERTWGCDAPTVLLDSAVDFIATGLPYPISAIFMTGDYVSHDIWQNNLTEMTQEVSTVTKMFRSTNLPLFPIAGNHEYFPPDQFIIPQAGTQTQTEDALNAYAATWSFVTQDASLRAGGFYTKLVMPGLRFVGLNTQYGDTINFWLYATGGLTGGPNQTAWLEGVLQQARQAGERVVLAQHMPCNHNAGIHDFYCQPFLALVAEYEDVIVLVISGHTHKDSWVNVGPFPQFVSPSITPFSHKNPAIRVYGMTDSFELVQVDTYILDLAKANAVGAANWQLEYSLPSAYGMPDLSAASFDAVAKNLLSNDTLWTQWATYHTCSVDNGTSDCSSEQCKKQEYCTLTSPTLAEWDVCVNG